MLRQEGLKSGADSYDDKDAYAGWHPRGEGWEVGEVPTVLEAVRLYFEARNQAWVEGHLRMAREVSGAHQEADWWQAVADGLRAKRTEMSYRNSRVLRAHTRVRVRDWRLQDAGGLLALQADEHVTWVYRDGVDLGVESRIISHEQSWRRVRGHWRLERAAESGEPSGWGSRPAAAGESVGPRSDGARLWSLYPNSARQGQYDRVRAMRFAELWWSAGHPAFVRLQPDSANFVSQCLMAGNLPMTGGQDPQSGWWYRFGDGSRPAGCSQSWGTPHRLFLHLVHWVGAEVLVSSRNLKIGDLVFYDWDGSGRFQHVAMVVDFDGKGDPVVNARSNPSLHRHYLYLDSRVWSPNTRYAFVHLPDHFG
ncbi:MAG: amidase domain-containing protein [Alicyclobacillus sp.]|nr:amidase domain-containing protein [Alicyclobacillus sp.]